MNAGSRSFPERTDLPLADPQPQPEGPRLPVPHVIRQRPHLWRSVINGSIITSWFAGLLLVVILLTTRGVGQILLYAVTVFATLLILGGLPYALLSASQQIEVTEHGLTLCYGYQAPPDRATGRFARRQHIGWHEIYTFAISPRSRAQALPNFYLVAGATGTVEWVRIRRHMPIYPIFLNSAPVRFAAASTPRLPFEEYDREMEALLNLIASKTSLPLYDLRGITWRP